jgi:hypothetical protein
MTATSTPPGIPSASRLAGWIGESLGGDPAELAGIQLIAGGRSNLTYRLTVSGPGGERPLVLRRPPLGHVLPTAHDMSREFRVLSALAGTEVPVAGPVAFCADADVIGAPFYLMEYVPGVVLRSRQDTAALTERQNADLSERLADMLAAIHGVDVEAVRARPRRRVPHPSARPVATPVGPVQPPVRALPAAPDGGGGLRAGGPRRPDASRPRAPGTRRGRLILAAPAAESVEDPAPRSRRAGTRRPALAGPSARLPPAEL